VGEGGFWVGKMKFVDPDMSVCSGGFRKAGEGANWAVCVTNKRRVNLRTLSQCASLNGSGPVGFCGKGNELVKDGTNWGKDKILRAELCGRCQGKVAFCFMAARSLLEEENLKTSIRRSRIGGGGSKTFRCSSRHGEGHFTPKRFGNKRDEEKKRN